MPTFLLSKQHQEIILILPKNMKNNCSGENFIILIGIFSPSGDPISLRRLHRGSFAVVYYSFISHILVAAAISERK